MFIKQLFESWDEDESDGAPERKSFVLKAGTILYHGTSSPDFNETVDDLDGPFWVSNGLPVAKYFMTWHKYEDGDARVVEYRLNQDLELLLIEDRHDLEELSDYYALDPSPNEMADQVCAWPFDGWIIPNNYPEGHDIMLCAASCLDYVKTHR